MNKLTQKLLAEGYSYDKYPSYVKLPNVSYYNKEVFDTLGGFRFQSWFQKQKVYATGCGLLCKGSRFLHVRMILQGIDWIPENDNPTILCPYKAEKCTKRHPFLNFAVEGTRLKLYFCDCHEVDTPYDFDQSIDKVEEERKRAVEQKFKDFAVKADGCVCRHQMSYDEWTEEWTQHYSPVRCAQHSCQKIRGMCSLRKVPLSKKSGNVFYDVRIEKEVQDDTIFFGQVEVMIKKGCQFFQSSKSLTVCEEVARLCAGDIQYKENTLYHEEIRNYGWRVTIQNIRVERRESRDLFQDLQDIRSGIMVNHASDLVEKKKADKKEKMNQRKKKRLEKLEKKILGSGLVSFKPYSAEYHYAEKWLGRERLNNLDRLHTEQLEKKKNMPVQIELSDIL
ncbi:hypothetical protein QMP26_41690 (plasmid) [Enterocloster clostridioformis]